MSKRQWLCLMGVWIMIFLFLGFPLMWHKVIAIISGIIIIAIAYNIPGESKKNVNDSIPPSSSAFVENEMK